MERAGAAARPVTVLFISKNYPPRIGGIQRFSQDFYRHMRQVCAMDLVKYSGPKAGLLFFMAKALWRALRGGHAIVHLADGTLALLGVLIKVFTKKRVVISLHGLDLVWRCCGYKAITRRLLARLDAFHCVSESTADVLRGYGLPEEKITVIHNALSAQHYTTPSISANDLFAKYRIPTGCKLVLMCGRGVKRKGFAWFFTTIYSRHAAQFTDIHFVLIGSGGEQRRVARLARRCGWSNVRVLGAVPAADLHAFYSAADYFFMPNIPVKGNKEGFGIVAIEAGYFGLYTIAHRIDGIAEALVPGITGTLLRFPAGAGDYARAFRLAYDRQEVRRAVRERYMWPGRTASFLALYRGLLR